jgi:hypothetical protein
MQGDAYAYPVHNVTQGDIVHFIVVTAMPARLIRMDLVDNHGMPKNWLLPMHFGAMLVMDSIGENGSSI